MPDANNPQKNELVAALAGWVGQYQRMCDELVRFILPRIDSITVAVGRIEKLPSIVQSSLRFAGLPAYLPPTLADFVPIIEQFEESGVEASAARLMSLAVTALGDDEGRARMLDSWVAGVVPESRIAILRDAMWAHGMGRYTLSIPSFFTQLEGLVIDSSVMVGKRHAKLVGAVRALASSEELMGAVASEFLSDKILQGFDDGLPMPQFSRHAILHGEDVDYGTVENSVRAIMLFDYVCELLSRGMPYEDAVID